MHGLLRDVVLLVIGFVVGGFLPNPAKVAANWLSAKWHQYVH
jgi:hypothetical protein